MTQKLEPRTGGLKPAKIGHADRANDVNARHHYDVSSELRYPSAKPLVTSFLSLQASA